MDKKNGFGILYLTNGEKYSGTFVNDTVDGYGLFYQLEGQPVSGQWEDGIFLREMK